MWPFWFMQTTKKTNLDTCLRHFYNILIKYRWNKTAGVIFRKHWQFKHKSELFWFISFSGFNKLCGWLWTFIVLSLFLIIYQAKLYYVPPASDQWFSESSVNVVKLVDKSDPLWFVVWRLVPRRSLYIWCRLVCTVTNWLFSLWKEPPCGDTNTTMALYRIKT